MSDRQKIRQLRRRVWWLEIQLQQQRLAQRAFVRFAQKKIEERDAAREAAQALRGDG